MRFGGNVFGCTDPESWAAAAKEMGYSAVYMPVDHKAPTALIDDYVAIARENDLVIAEVGVWNNLLDPDPAVREKAFERAVGQLELADYAGANCCVNIAGTYSTQWDGPHPDNLTRRGYDDIVDTVQRIIDAAKPVRTYYALEPMAWMYPDCADSCASLMRDVARDRFGVHFDPVNITSSPRLYYGNGNMIREWFDKLGPYIRSCHAKDITLSGQLTVHLSECRPGTGNLDYGTYIAELDKLGDDACLMLEHMNKKEDYVAAMRFLRATAAGKGVRVK